MNEPTKSLVIVIFLVLSVFALGSFSNGVSDAAHRYSWSRCSEPAIRLDYILPFYKLGCWFGKVPGS